MQERRSHCRPCQDTILQIERHGTSMRIPSIRKDGDGRGDRPALTQRKRASTSAAARRCEEPTNGSAANPDKRCSGTGQERQSPGDGPVSNRSAVHGATAPHRSSARPRNQTPATATSRETRSRYAAAKSAAILSEMTDAAGPAAMIALGAQPAKCRPHTSSSVTARSGQPQWLFHHRTIRIKPKREDIAQQRTNRHRISDQQR